MKYILILLLALNFACSKKEDANNAAQAIENSGELEYSPEKFKTYWIFCDDVRGLPIYDYPQVSILLQDYEYVFRTIHPETGQPFTIYGACRIYTK